MHTLTTRESTHLCGVTIMDDFIKSGLTKRGHPCTTATPAAPWAKRKKGILHPPICFPLRRKGKWYWFCFPINLSGLLKILYPIAWLNYRIFKYRIKRMNVDLILNNGDNQIAALLTRIGNELGIPVVTINHTAYWIYLATEIKWKRLSQAFIRAQNRNSLYVHNHSNARIMLSQWFRDHYFDLNPQATKESVFILRNVILQAETPDEKERDAFLKEIQAMPFYGKGPVAAIVGRLEEVKNLPFMLEVVADYKTRQQAGELIGAMPQLVFIGSGPYQIELEKKAVKLGISDHVHFLGERKNPWVRKFLLWIADLLCTPSISEVYGLTPPEARADGCPALIPLETAMEETSPPGYALPLVPGIWSEAINSIVTASPEEKHVTSAQLREFSRRQNDPEVYFNRLLKIIDHARHKVRGR